MNIATTESFRPNKDLSNTDLSARLAVMLSLKYGASEPFMKVANFANKHNVPLLKQACAFMVKNTAIRLFFGGVGIDQTQKTAEKLLDKGIGVIVDYSAPEGTKELNEETLKKVRQEYIDALGMCKNLAEYKQNDSRVSIALKVSTMAEFKDLKELSEVITSGKTFNQDQQKIYERIREDMFSVLKKAKEGGVQVYVDAEETAVNPVIKSLTKEALQKDLPLNVTIQAYLQDTKSQVDDWLEFSKQKVRSGTGEEIEMGKMMGVKLVRGAYMKSDTEDRNKIWETKDGTDNAYNAAFKDLYLSNQFAYITVATHNQESLRLAAELTTSHAHAIDTKVDSATLQGMGGSLDTGNLATSKYLPYVKKGEVLDSIPYTFRRGVEFTTTKLQDGTTRLDEELKSVWDEVKHRLGNSVNKGFQALTEAINIFEGMKPGNRGRT